MSGQSQLGRSVLDRIDAGLVLVDPRTHIIEWVNPAGAALLGLPAEGIVGQPCLCFLCLGEDGNCPASGLGKDMENVERVLVRHDGSAMTVMKSVKRIQIDGKEKLLETFIDISERKRVEAARSESEDRYRVLFETSREAMMILAPPEWKFVSANSATLTLFGVKEQETFVSLSPWALSPLTQPDGRPSMDKAREMIETALREGSHSFEWQHKRLDGQVISTSVQLTRLAFAGQILVQATVRDLTPTERAFSALRNSEERLRLAVEATGMGTYRWDHATGTTDYSPEFLALYDLPPDGTLALGPDLVPLAVVDQDRPVFQAAMTAGNDPQGDGVMKADYRIRCSNGSTRWLMARGRTEFKDSSGARKPSLSAGIIMDITERKRTEELAAVRLRLQEFAVGHTLDEMLQNTVDEAEILTGSLVGFYHFVEPDQTTLSLQAWSTRTIEKFCRAEGHGRHYSIDQAGVWVDCIRERRPIIHNDYASLPNKKGLPEGHSPLVRELVVPILRNSKIVAVLGVGNKAVVYGDADVDALTYLADVAWEISQRKLAENALRESEEQLDKIFNSSSNGMSFTEPVSGKILDVNDKWTHVCGTSRAEAIGKTALELGIWANKHERDDALELLKREGHLCEFEATLAARGELRRFAVNAEFVNLRRGRFLLWELRDITERMRADELLRRYELLAKHTRDIVLFVQRDDGRIVDANAAAMEAYGYGREELLSLSVRDLRLSDTQILTEAQMALADTAGLRFETVHRRKDGSSFPVEVSSVGAWIGGVRTLMSVVRDIGERKRTEQEIALLKHSIDGHTDAAYWFNPDGKFIYVNDAGCAALGFERHALMAMSLADVNPNATAERMPAVWEVLRKKGSYRSESAHRHKDGREFPVEILTSYVQFDGKEYACGFARDISERKAAEADKAKLQEQLAQAQKMESVGRLAGGVAHDFNNMLGVILGYSELALEKIGQSNSLYTDLMNIRSAAQRSAELTRQLLAFARKQTVAPKVLQLNETVAGMLKMVKRLIGEDVELVWRPGEELWPVKIDPSQIDQILANLCVNARDAIANVGKITIETGTKSIAAVEPPSVTNAAPGDYVWLAVRDNGCGMDQSTLAHVFEPFFTTKEVGKGTGLGLATVYGIVKQNQGFIDLSSDVGQGTALTIFLPRHTGKDAVDRTNASAGAIHAGQETILLVEDESPLLEVTQRMLERRGYKVLAANTPGQALQLAREHAGNIDLLMTDVVMPEMNGRDLARNFLSLYPSAKRLFMSGYTADVIAHQGVLDEGVHFIQKPFSAQSLTATVRKVLDTQRVEAG